MFCPVFGSSTKTIAVRVVYNVDGDDEYDGVCDDDSDYDDDVDCSAVSGCNKLLPRVRYLL